MIKEIFGFGNRILDKFVQGRKERWRNQIYKLTKEKEKLLKGKANAKKIRRLEYINNKLDELNRLCQNK